MKYRLPFAAAVAAVTLFAAPGMAQTVPPAMISVTGEATVSVAPDQAQIDGGVTSEAKTAREASDANNSAMGKVLLALKGAGIDEKDSRPRGCRCSRKARRTAPAARRRSSATAPAIA